MEPFPLSESPRPAEKRASTGARLLNLYAMAAYKRGQQTGNKHNAGNDRQRTAVAPRGFANTRYQQRPEYTCKTTGRKHEAIGLDHKLSASNPKYRMFLDGLPGPLQHSRNFLVGRDCGQRRTCVRIHKHVTLRPMDLQRPGRYRGQLDLSMVSSEVVLQFDRIARSKAQTFGILGAH